MCIIESWVWSQESREWDLDELEKWLSPLDQAHAHRFFFLLFSLFRIGSTCPRRWHKIRKEK